MNGPLSELKQRNPVEWDSLMGDVSLASNVLAGMRRSVAAASHAVAGSETLSDLRWAIDGYREAVEYFEGVLAGLNDEQTLREWIDAMREARGMLIKTGQTLIEVQQRFPSTSAPFAGGSEDLGTGALIRLLESYASKEEIAT